MRLEPIRRTQIIGPDDASALRMRPQALNVPANRVLLLDPARPLEVRPTEEILDADPVRDEHDPGQEDEQRGEEHERNDHEFHGYHQVTFCRKPAYLWRAASSTGKIAFSGNTGTLPRPADRRRQRRPRSSEH